MRYAWRSRARHEFAQPEIGCRAEADISEVSRIHSAESGHPFNRINDCRVEGDVVADGGDVGVRRLVSPRMGCSASTTMARAARSSSNAART
jgi:hypothetical protein